MKVLSLVYDAIQGGTEGQCARIVLEHQRQGIEHNVALFREKGAFLEAYKEAGAYVYHFDIQKMFSWDTRKKTNEFAEYLRSENYDILHAWDMDAGIFGYPAAKKAGIKFINSRRNLAETMPWHKRLMLKRVDKKSAAVVVNARCIAEMLLGNGVPESKIREIPNVVDYQAYYANENKAGNKVGMLCRLDPEKDVWTFLKIAEAIGGEVEFHIGGTGSEEEALKAYASGLPNANNIHWHGEVKDVPAFLADMDVAMLTPKANEGLSNAILEYLAASLPVVASDNGGNRQLMDASVAGQIFPSGDILKAATSLRKYLEDGAAREEAGARARAYVEGHHDLSRVSERFKDLYLHV